MCRTRSADGEERTRLLGPLGLCVVLLLDDATNGVNGTFDGLPRALLWAALVGVAAVLLVNVVLYRAGRSQPMLRRVHGWAVVVLPVVIVAWCGIAQAGAPQAYHLTPNEARSATSAIPAHHLDATRRRRA
ncbi:hypothetical protein J1G42_14545 [Cellulomonas sp. zg-ZUI222]|uniref:hypothetical protein n=1 Tax=Cellulomonas wangleii TaxID=2816956 RepID=UPI001A94B123|nr:hypothetical protein [Cellulomonas wangleii]MBO0922040.1 hypothetical protein [Cellulomonas wangleii]